MEKDYAMISSNIMGDALKQQKQIEKLRWKMQNNVVNEDKVDKINMQKKPLNY